MSTPCVSRLTDRPSLYDARSKAVHQGRLSSTINPDLVTGDRLVTLALRALVERGGFPDWSALTMAAGAPFSFSFSPRSQSHDA